MAFPRPPQAQSQGKLAPRRPFLLLALFQILLLSLPLYLWIFGFFSPSIPTPRDARSRRLESLCGTEARMWTDSRPRPLPWLAWTISLPQSNLTAELVRRNRLPPRNLKRFPDLPEDSLVFVLYVHNRPQYLRMAVQGLSAVEGIGEVLLVVSHDGFFPEMNAIVEGITFCRVKQIFFPYSPHLFEGAFPGATPGDCLKKDGDGDEQPCLGKADQYGNYRTPRITSLKHHWWWMMNTVWDGLEETRGYSDHIVFIEEDHFLLPNAYRNMQILSALKSCRCPDCFAANLAPAEVTFRGERAPFLVAEKIGNIGYAFNRSIWRRIHMSAPEFCTFDDYNWDITMWTVVYPEWGPATYTLRGPRASAIHFGQCGLHQGQKESGAPCLDGGSGLPPVDDADKVPNINGQWEVKRYPIKGYNKGFKGWGGWGDDRDHQLCLQFGSMYHL